MNKLSIIIPCYNEEQSIAKTVEGLLSALSSDKFEFEIIIVDDASKDKTPEILTTMIGPLRIITNEVQLGYGGSLKRGIAQAAHPMVLIIDADGTYPCEAVPQLFHAAIDGGHDMVVGARTKKNAAISSIRRSGKFFIGWLAEYLCERKIPDLNSGLRVMRKKVLEKYLHILPNGFSLTTTITLAMLTNGYSVSYIPVDYYKREGRSKIRPVKDTLNFILLIVRTIMYFNPLKIFLPLSLVLFLMGVSLLIIRIFVAKILISVTIFSLLSSFIVLSLGLLADLIDRRTR